MKAVILYHPKSAEARTVEDYAKDFKNRTNRVIEMVSLETREGAATASLYDIVRYPALMVLDQSGHLQMGWQGQELPLMDELTGYLAA